MRVYTLTRRQLDCARVIAELTHIAGRPPSFDEIAVELAVNKSSAHRLVCGLEERGWLEPRRHGQKRALRLTQTVTLRPECEIEMTPEGRAYLEAM